ncbi:hypothetical protein JG687_00018528 [Phytophthora cactorum]|uniref:Uncharacterized protein n=1 Tax=Phytophthora cactorum TaxID=29920 RepID=A0A8T1TPK2_9STRA|nr:hypothetical protein JG687_00018528 [Phytophthora cactorum]
METVTGCVSTVVSVKTLQRARVIGVRHSRKNRKARPHGCHQVTVDALLPALF